VKPIQNDNKIAGKIKKDELLSAQDLSCLSQNYQKVYGSHAEQSGEQGHDAL